MATYFLDTRYRQALTAFINGCNNSEDIADELQISKAHASLLVSELHKDGLIRRTGRRLPRKENNNAMTAFVYEVVTQKDCLRNAEQPHICEFQSLPHTTFARRTAELSPRGGLK